MILLVAGVALFCALHLLPSAAPAVRVALASGMGEHRYRGLFALLSLAGIALIVTGWKLTVPAPVYVPPLAPGLITGLVMFVALVLFVAARARTSIRRLVRHPQLTAVMLWGIAHLLVNGDSRSLVLFGGLTAWAGLTIPLCNRRDGPWQRPERQPAAADATVLAAAAIAFAAIAYLHRWLFGVPAGTGLPSL